MTTFAFMCPIGDTVPPKTFQSALSVGIHAQASGLDIKMIGVTERTLIDNARNMLVDQFLKTDCEWAFWIDSDMVLPKETLVQLYKVAQEKNSKMVTGVYYQRVGKHWPVLWNRSPETENGKKIRHQNEEAAKTNKYLGAFTMPGPECKYPFKVHAAGFGCTLIHREVFERMEKPWFKFIKGVCSEDFYFFVEAQELGYELWADPSLEIGHIGEAPVITRHDLYKWMQENDGCAEPISVDK